MGDILERLERIFEEKISKKTGWGKNEIMMVYRESVQEVLLEIIDGKLK
jgi:hypothetical protein